MQSLLDSRYTVLLSQLFRRLEVSQRRELLFLGSSLLAPLALVEYICSEQSFYFFLDNWHFGPVEAPQESLREEPCQTSVESVVVVLVTVDGTLEGEVGVAFLFYAIISRPD